MPICNIHHWLFEFLAIHCDALSHVKDWDWLLSELIVFWKWNLAIIVAIRKLCVKTGKGENHCVGPVNLSHHSRHRFNFNIVFSLISCRYKLLTINCDFFKGFLIVASITIRSIDLVKLPICQLYILTTKWLWDTVLKYIDTFNLFTNNMTIGISLEHQVTYIEHFKFI